ncbi:type VI secretion system Vgr family protein, partial [Burkholderia gladioli]|nr:type VI secretion system Vgr family protein [Burkholderia gladioli]
MSNSKHDLTRLALDFQHDRLLRFEFEGEAPYPLLLANRIDGTESLSRDFQFTIEILSDHAALPARDFIGRKLTLSLLRGDGSQRYFNGYVFSFRQLGSDGACACYEAVIGPWLRYLRYGRHNRLFLDRNLRRQTEAVFEDYGNLPDWAWHVGEDDPPVKMACQFGEHDHNYVHRRWEQAGLRYGYEHRENGHRLIVADPGRPAPPIDGDTHEIRFHSGMGAQEADSILNWSPFQQTTSTHAELSRFDFKSPLPTHVRSSLQTDANAVNTKIGRPVSADAMGAFHVLRRWIKTGSLEKAVKEETKKASDIPAIQEDAANEAWEEASTRVGADGKRVSVIDTEALKRFPQ